MSKMEAKKAGSSEQVAKKVWHIARVVFFMLRRGISSSRIALDLSLIAKRGNKLASKAISNFLTFNGLTHHHHHHHHSTATTSSLFSGCRSGHAAAAMSPQEYEFSCSNTPASNAFASLFPFSKRNKNGGGKNDDVATVAAVQSMLEMLNRNEAAAVCSSAFVSAAASPLPGFGVSPAVRQLRITDSPFPVGSVEEEEGGGQVDKAADEFIKRFYKDLKSERAVADHSPRHGFWGR